MTDQWNEGSDGRLEFEIRVPEFRADRFYVYIAWGEDRGRPLYVGKGNRPFTRIGLHLAGAKWARDVRSFECHAFLTSEDALEAEMNAIHELNPTHNVIRRQSRRMFEESVARYLAEQDAR